MFSYYANSIPKSACAARAGAVCTTYIHSQKCSLQCLFHSKYARALTFENACAARAETSALVSAPGVCVCMYVCMYVVCMYVCMYVCVCMFVYVCLYVCMFVCMYVYVCMYVCMFVCLFVCMHSCMYVFMYVCMYVLRV